MLIAAIDATKRDIDGDIESVHAILEAMGPQARPAVPALRALHRRSERHRDAIETALKRIEGIGAK